MGELRARVVVMVVVEIVGVMAGDWRVMAWVKDSGVGGGGGGHYHASPPVPLVGLRLKPVSTLARVPSGSMPASRNSLRSRSAVAKSLFLLASTHWAITWGGGQTAG